jgi:hypothetical protein
MPEELNDKAAEREAVKAWTAKIRRAREFFKEDFKRMRDNMKFAAGIQWAGQKTMETDKYTVNLTNKSVNAKVATLYARNPIAEFQRRKRLNFQLYNGKLESLMPIMQQAMSNPMGLQGLAPEQMAMLADFQHGLQEKEMIDRVGQTLEILYQYQIDEQDEEQGDFKLQMKQLVRRVVTTGVGYARVSFVREEEAGFISSGTTNTNGSRIKQAQQILSKIQNSEVPDNSPMRQQLQNFMTGAEADEGNVKERLVFDFIPSTQLIVDPHCRALKGFVGANWVAQQFILPVSDVNAIFGVDVKVGDGAKQYSTKGKEDATAVGREAKDQMCCLWEVLDKTTRTCMYIVDGHPDFVAPPEPVTPSVKGFWPIVALTFNDVEVEEGCDVSIYPPSDVQLMKHAQKEWNRTRQELKKHRMANAPGYLASKGLLTQNDKERLEAAPSNAVVELEGIPQGVPIGQVIVPRANVPIQPGLYDDSTMMRDIQVSTGQSAENMNIVPASATATGQTIAEQSKMTVSGSNVDDLDDFLSALARIGGEMLLKEMSEDTAKMLVGPGAVLPMMDEQRQMYLNHIYLTTKAASSGRPNKAIEMRNWQIAAPVLQSNGANQQFLVRETLRRLDENIDPEQAFPLMPPAALPQYPQGGQHQPSPQGQHELGITAPPEQQRPGPGASMDSTPI